MQKIQYMTSELIVSNSIRQYEYFFLIYLCLRHLNLNFSEQKCTSVIYITQGTGNELIHTMKVNIGNGRIPVLLFNHGDAN